ncbi:MAG: 50S ribosomal protein L18 [Phycisphaerae bacterium]|nr:50S ribosomal protein L18 [Phycisphaerae bacterium]
MDRNKAKVSNRGRRRQRIRKKVFGTPDRPRLSVFRSGRHMYAQIINDSTGVTLVSASTRDKLLAEQLGKTGNRSAAGAVGQAIAERARAAHIDKVVFDRGGYRYQGRVKELADAARKAGLSF